MRNVTKRLFLFGVMTIGLCNIFPCLAQSALLSVSSYTPSINDSLNNISLLSVDGPYLFRNKKEGKVLSVVQGGETFQLNEEVIDLDQPTQLKCVVDNKDRDAFFIPIMDQIKSPKSTYKQPEKLLAISDIEGNFNAFYGLLVSNGVMDKAYNWTYGEGHLVLIGDFMDRGDNVTQVLWLIYKLEQAAKEKGGMVHFILGNHEILNLQGQTNYVDKKYTKLAKRYVGKLDNNEAYLDFMSDNRELVKWLKSKNAVEKIGNTLFVHGGISQELVSARFGVNHINNIIRSRLKNGPSRNEMDKMDEDFMFASHGPLWYRGLATPYRRMYKKATPGEVKRALRHFHVDHIAIGHTIAQEISLDYNGGVIRTDVKHGIKKYSEHSQGLLIENNQLYRVNAKGEKTKLGT